MAKLLSLIALCVLLALASTTRIMKNPLVVTGQVHCDRCHAGFETPNFRSMVGAKVRIERNNRKTSRLVYSKDGYTDSAGYYKIQVSEDHLDEVCNVVLVKSSQPDCAQMCPGREKFAVVLTTFNGIASNTRFANAMGFMLNEAEAGCDEIMKLYQDDEENL